MNTPNNKRKRESQDRIEKAFLQRVQTREINEIKVSDLCNTRAANGISEAYNESKQGEHRNGSEDTKWEIED